MDDRRTGDSRVDYGTSPAALTSQATSGALVTSHAVDADRARAARRRTTTASPRLTRRATPRRSAVGSFTMPASEVRGHRHDRRRFRRRHARRPDYVAQTGRRRSDPAAPRQAASSAGRRCRRTGRSTAWAPAARATVAGGVARRRRRTCRHRRDVSGRPLARVRRDVQRRAVPARWVRRHLRRGAMGDVQHVRPAARSIARTNSGGAKHDTLARRRRSRIASSLPHRLGAGVCRRTRLTAASSRRTRSPIGAVAAAAGQRFHARRRRRRRWTGCG